MKQITQENSSILKQSQNLIFIHSPFCRTCQLAKDILLKMEEQAGTSLFYEMNAVLFPTFMQAKKIESVPSLIIQLEDGNHHVFYSIKDIEKMAVMWSKYQHANL
ncbi:thioredoxin family protein [Paraliobacillus salinarum]|uniref:thioredoxin family protein n=1 Tax=Paraliobacillus salinarum TaxID=1158996 RepID=UPI0015F648EE|nr:thioredoxin family protein [Paraliobacillus salinarum]